MENLLAVVMCGGESKRMGRDKGLIRKGGIPWAKLVANIFEGLHLPYVVSVNRTQVPTYSEVFSADLLIIDGEGSVEGPLTGLLSVHQMHPEKDLLLIACDMVEMELETVKALLELYSKEKGYDFYGYQSAQIIEPFCSIYASNFLKQILKEATQGKLQHFSMQNVIRNGRQRLLSANENRSFKNFNTPATDL